MAEQSTAGSNAEAPGLSSPADAFELLGQCRRLITQGESAQARSLALSLVGRFPDHAELLSAAGVVALQAGDQTGSLELLRRAVTCAPGDVAAQRTLAEALQAIGRLQEAAHAFVRVTELDPGDLQGRFGLAVVHERLGSLVQAEAGYRHCLTLRPGLAPAWLGIGNTLRGQGRLDQAQDAYREALRIDGNLVGAWNNLGGLLQERGEHEAAENAYQRVVTIAPGHADAWYNLGVCRRHMGRASAAERALRRAADLRPRDPRIRMNHGIALQDAERLDEALAVYHKAIANVAPTDRLYVDLMGKLHSLVADVHLQRGDPEAALAACDDYLARRPGDSSMLAVKATALNDLGREEALRELIDWEHLVRATHLAPPAGYGSLAAFNAVLTAQLKAHPSLRYAPHDHATRNGMHSGNLLAGQGGPFAELRDLLHEALAEHVRRVVEWRPDHPFLACRPARLALRMWGVVMHRQGHQIPHLHPASWLSGCYYPQVPAFVTPEDGSRAGWIEFGRTPEWFHHRREMVARAFPPQEGLLLLFPGYLWHRTVPFETAAERISIAFDFVSGSADANVGE